MFTKYYYTVYCHFALHPISAAEFSGIFYFRPPLQKRVTVKYVVNIFLWHFVLLKNFHCFCDKMLAHKFEK